MSRLFVALLPPAEVLDEVAAGISRVERPGLRWIDPTLWHVTLAFLGEVPEPVMPDLHVRLSRAASRYSPMTLSFRGAGAFPSPAHARVLWVGLTVDPVPMGDPGRIGHPGRTVGAERTADSERPERTADSERPERTADSERTVRRSGRHRPPGPERLKRLAASVAAGAQRAGAREADRKPFHPHLTLARARHGDDLRDLVDSMRAFEGREWKAKAVHLMRSHLGAHVRYEPLAAYPLGGRD